MRILGVSVLFLMIHFCGFLSASNQRFIDLPIHSPLSAKLQQWRVRLDTLKDAYPMHEGVLCLERVHQAIGEGFVGIALLSQIAQLFQLRTRDSYDFALVGDEDTGEDIPCLLYGQFCSLFPHRKTGYKDSDEVIIINFFELLLSLQDAEFVKPSWLDKCLIM